MNVILELTWCENNTTDFAKSIMFNASMCRIVNNVVEVSVNKIVLDELIPLLTEYSIKHTYRNIIDDSYFITLNIKTDIFSSDNHTELRVREVY